MLTFSSINPSSIQWNTPLDISIPLRAAKDNVAAWYVEPPRFEPVVMGDWIGDVNQGGTVNFRNIFFNPHGHGTHTECVGHISKEPYTINQCLKKFMFSCRLITVSLVNNEIKKDAILAELKGKELTEALVIRTVPNSADKLSRHYSKTNPPYFEPAALQWMAENTIEHLLTDLPSVDPEEDGGALLAHKAFWQYPQRTRLNATITELIYVSDGVKDGLYVLNLQIASFENDASPSKPVLYAVQ
ncbi:MAG: cyclase family protein [Flavobacteriales bacterium]